MSELATIEGDIEATATKAENWTRGRQILTIEDEAYAIGLRTELETLKLRAELARDGERLPLIAKVQDVQAKYAPKLATLKKADDVVRLALKAWKKRQREAQHDACS